MIVAIWAPVILGPTISGSKVIAVEHIRVLSRRFQVVAFVLVSARKFAKAQAYKNLWFEGADAKVVVLPCLSTRGSVIFSKLFAAAIASLAIAHLHFAGRIGLLITRDSVSSLPLVILSRLIHIPVLYDTHSVPFGFRESELLGGSIMRNRIAAYAMKGIDYFVLQHAHFVGVVSTGSSTELISMFGSQFKDKLVAFPLSIPDEFYNPCLEIRPISSIELIYNGSISPLYDFSELVKALKAMRSAGKRVSLTIYGRRFEREAVERWESGASLIEFKDQVPRREIINILRQATAVVIPLSAETPGTPVKALEAMALGVPVIISHPQDRSLFRDGETCFVVSDDMWQSWEIAILRATVPELREKVAKGARAAAELFRSTHTIDTVLRILRAYSQ
jgi:glycosyltransferase involved in cell wall biosynthesis